MDADISRQRRFSTTERLSNVLMNYKNVLQCKTMVIPRIKLSCVEFGTLNPSCTPVAPKWKKYLFRPCHPADAGTFDANGLLFLQTRSELYSTKVVAKTPSERTQSDWLGRCHRVPTTIGDEL